MCAALIAQYFIIKLHSKTSTCAADRVFSEFASLEAVIAVIISFVILFGQLAWAQRYTNAPGNLAWAPLMLGYVWGSQFSTPMMIIGVVMAFVSLITFFVHMANCSGTSVTCKKIIVGEWIFTLLLMIGC